MRWNSFLIISYLAFGLVLLFEFPASANDSSKPVYTYCADPDWMPYEGLIRGEHKGISAEYKQIFEQQGHLSFKLVGTNSWDQTTEFLQAGKCDLTLILNRSEQRDKYLSFTLPYFFSSNVLVTRSDHHYIQNLAAIGAEKLAVVSSYRLNDYIEKYHPNVNKFNVGSELDGLKAVNSGKMDIYVGSLLSITSKLKELNQHDLKINGWVAVQDELRVGVIKSKAQELVPKLNQIIDSLPVKTHNDIYYRWSNTQIVKQTDYTLLWQGASVFGFALLFFVWRYFDSLKVTRVLLKKNEQLELLHSELEQSNTKLKYLSYHDNLTGLYNRHYFLTTFKHMFNDTKRQNGNVVLMMIDIDHFKKVNDEFGHLVGDAVLKTFGEQLQLSLREGDVAARWGGEEFILLLPSTSEQESLQVAHRLKDHIAQFSFPEVQQITISIGLTEFQSNDSSNSWLERADCALYQAKSSGRNRVVVIS